MKKILLLFLCVISFNAIHAEITWTLYDDGTLTISGTGDMEGAPWRSQSDEIKKVVIKDGVTSIGGFAFYGCSGLTSVTIPNSVTSIGYYAFYGTKWYDKQPDGVVYAGKVLYAYKGTMPSNSIIEIKEGTTEITPSAFEGCSGLISIIIPNSVTSIGGSAFSGCSGLTSVTIPNSVTSIGYHAFEGCTGLTSVTIPNSVTSIEVAAFTLCSGLTSLTIPNSVTSIGDGAFEYCSGLTSITVEKGNTYYDSRDNCNAIIATKSNTLIRGCKNTDIPNSVTSIESSAFKGCSGLTSVTIPNSVTSIGENAFYGCTGLTSLTIGNSVTSIGEEAFYGCSGLTYVTIGNSVTSIGSSAFLGAKLRNIVIKAKTPPSWDKTEHYHGTFSNQTLYHTTLMIPEGSWDAYAYSDNWYQFINIREVAYNAVNLTNSKAYMLKSSNEGSYLFYDSVNDCVASLNETALDDTEENNTWMTVEVEGKHYVYNLGAKKFLVADKTNAKTGYSLSDVPASIDIEDGKDAIVFGKSKEFYLVINDKLNVDENLESQIIATTGIKGMSAEANQPTVTYNVNGQIVPDNTKGLRIKNGKKIIIK